MKLSERLESVRQRRSEVKILVLGDFVIDRHMVAEAGGISKEAPIPAFSIRKELIAPGASFNAVKNLQSLGFNVSYVTVVGSDADGDAAIERVRKKVRESYVVVDRRRKTDTVFRVFSDGYLVLWAEKSQRKELSDEAERTLIERISEASKGVSAVVVSDHARGVITEGVMKGLADLSAKSGVPIVVNGRPERADIYRNATHLRMSRSDASAATGISPVNETSIRNMALRISSMSGVDNVLITWLEDGFFGLSGESFFRIKPVEVKRANLIGIGDVITSSLAAFLSMGLSFEESARASYYNAILCASGKAGREDLYNLIIEMARRYEEQ
ncbi:MAG: bifunctional heptose 7-phosphate kinase/heptose 1-phosphate adenyltransferase [Nitrososphaeria archaeon]